MKVYNKRTNIDGREPSVNEMEHGEIAVNYNATNPRLIIKDSNNEIEKFLPESNINGRMDNVNDTLSNLNEKINENKDGIETIESWINTPITDEEITKIMYPEITFSVTRLNGGTNKTYQATKGMTWEKWINSNKYDIISPEGKNFVIQGDNISVIGSQNASDRNLLYLNRTTLLLKTDKIIENHTYLYDGEK